MPSPSKSKIDLKRIRSAREITRLTGQSASPFNHRNHRTHKRKKDDTRFKLYRKKKKRIIDKENNDQINVIK